MGKRIVAYTYYIEWKGIGKKYYGVRYSKCLEKRTPEEDFWTYYKGSSKDTKFDRIKGTYDGIQPDVKRIHKIFYCKKEALLYEQKFLTRVKAKYKEEWLNKSDKHGVLVTEDFCNKMKNREVTWKCVGWTKGKGSFSSEHRKKLSETKKGQKNPFYGKKHNEKSIKQNREKNLYYVYKIECPDGNIVDVLSLKQFCREQNLIYSNMRQRNFSKGYKIISKKQLEKGNAAIKQQYGGKYPWTE